MPTDAVPPVPPTPPDRRHPTTVAEVLRDRTYSPECLRALRQFRSQKPWQGDHQERADKLRSLHGDLCIAYQLPHRVELVIPSRYPDCFVHNTRTNERQIHISPRLSVLSYLHEFAHALGFMGERPACDWSINLFRRIFPASYARLVPVGHLLVRREDAQLAQEAFERFRNPPPLESEDTP